MAYLGKALNSISTANIAVDTMTGDGSTNTMSISLGSKLTDSVNNVSVFISGVFQRPGTDYTLSGSTITFTTAPSDGYSVVAVSKGDSWKDVVADATVYGSALADNSLTDAKIIGLDASKLTGAMPAIDGSAVTNLPATHTVSSNDPATDTNPSEGVGALWINSTSGETFLCTDATTDENVWFNVGGGSGDVQPWTYQGTISGYAIGGSTPALRDEIDKWSFSSDGNATDVGNLTVARQEPAGVSSSSHGYACGGWNGSHKNIIDKHTFSSDSDATDVADMTTTKSNCSSAASSTNGYIASGNPLTDTIEKFPFASDSDATDIANLTVARFSAAGQSSSTHGYVSGGNTASNSNIIDKFTTSSDNDATDVGDLTVARQSTSGSSSTTHGYTAGGYALSTSSVSNVIDKFSFATDSDATDVGDLTTGRYTWSGPGASSVTHGYTSGGYTGADSNIIDKFSFSSDEDATDVGDLTVARSSNGGQQY